MRMYKSIAEIRKANAAAGQHWFDPSAIRFFSSRISEKVYGGRLFVSSECGPSGNRGYTVRYALSNGTVEDASEFQQYASGSGAHAAAQRLADSGYVHPFEDDRS